MPEKRDGNWESAARDPGQQPESGPAGAVRDQAQEMAHRAGEAWDTATDVWDELRGFLSRYPFAALGIGFGIGFFLSRLMGGGP